MEPKPKPLRCAICDFPLYLEQLDGKPTNCVYCEKQIKAFVFPAFFKSPEQGPPSAPILSREQAACFNHPRHQAQAVCTSCGRFICDLCNVRLHDTDLCAQCLEISVQQQTCAALETRRILYDNIALYLAIIPMLMLFPTLLTAPATIYLCIRYWRTPLSITPRTKIRFVLAFLLAGLQIGIWGAIFYDLVQ